MVCPPAAEEKTDPSVDGVACRSQLPAGCVTATTVQVKVAGDGSTLPAASTATTANVWVPRVNPVYVTGLEQLEVLPSSVQRKVELGSDDVNWNVAPVSVVELPGCAVIVVPGGVASPDDCGAAAATTTSCSTSARRVPYRL
jgi:hypothetical protein